MTPDRKALRHSEFKEWMKDNQTIMGGICSKLIPDLEAWIDQQIEKEVREALKNVRLEKKQEGLVVGSYVSERDYNQAVDDLNAKIDELLKEVA